MSGDAESTFERRGRGGIVLMLALAVLAPSAFSAVPLVGGVAVLEAEAFGTNLSPRSGHEWVFAQSIPGFSGEGYMQGLPDNDQAFANWSASSPELQFPVLFNIATTHYVWVRGYSEDADSDSVHWGLNGSPNAAPGIHWTPHNEWVWARDVAEGTVATIEVPAPGAQLFQLWIREDGARIDRIVITTNAAFQARKGNAWHIPHKGGEPVGQYAMRTPYLAIYPGTPVTIFSGNQFQGSPNAGNQLQTGSAIFYKAATGSVWQSAPMLFHSESGNNKFYSGVIPADVAGPGEAVEYYLRIPYSDFLPTFLYMAADTPQSTEDEATARANPSRFVVRHPPAAGNPSPVDWRDVNIYQVFTDRFLDGDPSNNTAHPGADYVPTAGNRIHGGDFRGIEQKLDYIQALGATALWIKPVHLNVGNAAYHGYGAHDFYQLAPNLGSIDDLKSLVAAAHARGIYVILDIVVNHQNRRIDSGDPGFPAYNAGGYTLRWTTGEAYPLPFNQVEHFHSFGSIQNFSDAQQLVMGDLNGLDDLKTETLYVRTNLVDIFTYWMELADLDGFRLDTVKHVEMGFWEFFNNEIRSFASAMGKTNFIQFGEVFDTSESGNGRFTGTQAGGAYANDSVLNFPLYGKVNSVFASASGNTRQIEDHYNAIPANYHPDARMRLINFLDNHDVRRFMHAGNANNNTGRLAVALTFLYSARGVPNLYYGTEQDFNGGDDPGNREDMFAGQFESGPSVGDNFNMTHPSFLHVARLNNFRRLYPCLRTGEHVNRWNDPSGPGLFAYARRLGGEEILVVLNTAGSSQTLTHRNTIYPPGTLLVNLFNTHETLTVTASSTTPPVAMPGTSSKMFIAQARWKPLDPVVQQQSPAHGAVDVAVSQPIVLHFNLPMDTNLAEQAFRLVPHAMGAFSWSSNRNTLTFTPSGPSRLADQTRYTVRLETSAVDLTNGHPLHGAFETHFVTGTAADADGDGLPDWWMQEHFHQTTGSVETLSMPWQDADEDTMSNHDELIAGTDPRDPQSRFALTRIEPEEVEMSSAFGRLYRLEANAATDEVWGVLAAERSGTGLPILFAITNEPPVHYYRGRVRLAPTTP